MCINASDKNSNGCLNRSFAQVKEFGDVLFYVAVWQYGGSWSSNKPEL